MTRCIGNLCGASAASGRGASDAAGGSRSRLPTRRAPAFSGARLHRLRRDERSSSPAERNRQILALRLLAGLARPEAARCASMAPRSRTISPRRRIISAISTRIKPSLSAQENLAFWRAMLGRPALSVGAALEAVGLGGWSGCRWRCSRPGRSAAWRWHVLLVAQRPLWLLDEPTTALDVSAQARFGELGAGACGGAG